MRRPVLIRAGSLREVARGLVDDHHELAGVPASIRAAAAALEGDLPHLGQEAEVLAREAARLVDELPGPAGWLRRLADRLDADEHRRFTARIPGGLTGLADRLARVRPSADEGSR